MGKILITGANGFIGSHITEYFVDKGYDIICLVRRSSDLKYIEKLNVKIVYADITNEEKLECAIEGADFVIHNAAKSSDWGKYNDFYQVNVEGSLNIFKVCMKKGIKDFIMTSSISVYGEENNPRIKDENSLHNSHYNYFLDKIFPCNLNYYRDTKKIAKEKIIEFSKINNLNVTFIEPTWVYGEREFNTGFYEYLKICKDKIPFLMGSTKNKFHIIYVKDLARAYYLTYKKKLKGINSIIVGNRKVEKMDFIYKSFCQEANYKKPRNIPKFLVYPLGFLLELIYTIMGAKKPPLITRGRINMFYDNIEYSTTRAKELLDFENEFSIEEGIKRTVIWYKEHGFL